MGQELAINPGWWDDTLHTGLRFFPFSLLQTLERPDLPAPEDVKSPYSVHIYTSKSARAKIKTASGDSTGSTDGGSTYASNPSVLWFDRNPELHDMKNPTIFYADNSDGAKITLKSRNGTPLWLTVISQQRGTITFDRIMSNTGEDFYFGFNGSKVIYITTNATTARSFSASVTACPGGSATLNKAVYLENLSVQSGDTIWLTLDVSGVPAVFSI